MLIVCSKLKEAAGDFSVASDFPEVLNKVVEQLVKEACSRAKENHRRTIMAKDLSLVFYK